MNACWQHKEGDGDQRQRGNCAHPVIAPRRPECCEDGANEKRGAVQDGWWPARNQWRKVTSPTAIEKESAPFGADQCPRVPCVDA